MRVFLLCGRSFVDYGGVMIAVGLVVLLYDHVLTFADEVRLVWLAPRSLAKYAFLLERYLVLGTLLCVACGVYYTVFARPGKTDR